MRTKLCTIRFYDQKCQEIPTIMYEVNASHKLCKIRSRINDVKNLRQHCFVSFYLPVIYDAFLVLNSFF